MGIQHPPSFPPSLPHSPSSVPPQSLYLCDSQGVKCGSISCLHSNLAFFPPSRSLCLLRLSISPLTLPFAVIVALPLLHRRAHPFTSHLSLKFTATFRLFVSVFSTIVYFSALQSGFTLLPTYLYISLPPPRPPSLPFFSLPKFFSPSCPMRPNENILFLVSLVNFLHLIFQCLCPCL